MEQSIETLKFESIVLEDYANEHERPSCRTNIGKASRPIFFSPLNH